MLGVNLIVLAVIGQAAIAPPDSASLVKQLGSPRYAERESAATALRLQGRLALPALRNARNSRDPEIQSRAGRLIVKIEEDLLTQPTPVRLDFHQATLSEVARSFSVQTGSRIALSPANMPRWKLKRINLLSPEPLGFWQAIDRLCDAAQLEYNTGIHGYLARREPIFSLTDRFEKRDVPVSDSGPFRVRLAGVHYQRDVDFALDRPVFGVGLDADRPIVIDRRTDLLPRVSMVKDRPRVSEQFYASLVVSAEPRLAVGLQGSARVVAAVDDRGQSLVSIGRATEHDSARNARFAPMVSSSDVALQVPLSRPATPGSQIKVLRGTIPLSVSSRRDDPLLIPLENSEGKTFDNADARIVMHSVRHRAETGQTVVELTIQTSDGPIPDDGAEVFSVTDSVLRSGPHPYQLEFVDEADQTVPWLSGFDSENGHTILTLTQPPGALKLKELRYFGLTRGVVSLPFEFKNLPLP